MLGPVSPVVLLSDNAAFEPMHRVGHALPRQATHVSCMLSKAGDEEALIWISVRSFGLAQPPPAHCYFHLKSSCFSQVFEAVGCRSLQERFGCVFGVLCHWMCIIFIIFVI